MAAGIFAGGGAGSTTQIYFNSISMTGDRGSGTTFPSYALAIGGSNPTVDARDNILFNTQTTAGTGKSYAVGFAYSTFTNLTSDSNDLFVSGTNTFVGQTGGLGTAGTDRATLAAFTGATGKDTNSINVDPQFTSTTNLQPLPASPVLDAGTSLAAFVTPYIDINGNTRTDLPSQGAFDRHRAVDNLCASGEYEQHGRPDSHRQHYRLFRRADLRHRPAGSVLEDQRRFLHQRPGDLNRKQPISIHLWRRRRPGQHGLLLHRRSGHQV